MVDVDGVAHAAVDHGGTGPDVLLLHQLASNAEVWAPVAPALTRIGHVVALDLRAHGRTRSPVGDPRDIATDVVPVAAALGLERPVVLVEQDEILTLSPDRLAALEAPAVGLLAVATTLRGEDAHLEWADQVGPDTLDVWDERFGLFASGRSEELEPYLDLLVARVHTDWVSQRIEAEQYRRFYRRHIETTPEGWRRRPTREEMERVVRLIEAGPHGLDLLDTVPAPLWLLISEEAMTDREVAALTTYVEGRDDRALRMLPGGPKVETLDPDALASAVAEMVERHVR